VDCYLGHSIDGVDYAVWTQRPRWVWNSWIGRHHWRSTGGCVLSGIHAHAVKELLGTELIQGELAKIRAERVRE